MLALRSVSSVRGVPALPMSARARARAPGGSSSRRASGRHSVRICANVSGLPDVAEGQWPIGRTLRERSPSQILNNFVSGVRPGAFRRENELFSGRIAMLGFLAAVVNEAQTGKGILEQLNAETGASVILEEDLLLFQIGIILVLAFTGITTGGQVSLPLINQVMLCIETTKLTKHTRNKPAVAGPREQGWKGCAGVHHQGGWTPQVLHPSARTQHGRTRFRR